MMKLRLILVLLTAVVAIAGLAGYQMIQWVNTPLVPPSAHPAPKIVLIPHGAPFHQVASLLDRERLIKSRMGFSILGKVRDAERKIHPGEYELSPAMRPADILDVLVSGRVVLHPVTIPEGYTMVQIADVLAQQHITDPAEFMRLTRDPQFIRSLGISAETLEGYLFPDTYRFARPSQARDVVRAMVDQWSHVFNEEWRARAKELDLTPHEVLTLASVIEKETGAGDERPQISSVFHNRLKRKIPLQSDPTVIYGLTTFDGNLHKTDLSHPSPYNTYRWTGLPPGPIASPGAQSIRAALYPVPSAYLYFVSRNDGTHQFSATLVEHNKAVEQYQKRPFKRSGQPPADGRSRRSIAITKESHRS
ncbi:MAG: endolytic transglycosylase MltG [Nitrospiraceae bacterium]|nr:endolytic transglycosylase MltG [Nitrospiraceae bacterium]